jgi:cysteine desulfurase
MAAKYCNEKIKQFEEISTLRDFMEQEILKIAPNAMIIGSEVLRLPNTSSIRMPNVKSEEQLIRFDLAGISISAGAACSSGRIATSHVLKAMHIDEKIANEVIRVSLGLRTTKKQIEKFIKLWKEICIK